MKYKWGIVNHAEEQYLRCGDCNGNYRSAAFNDASEKSNGTKMRWIDNAVFMVVLLK